MLKTQSFLVTLHNARVVFNYINESLSEGIKILAAWFTQEAK